MTLVEEELWNSIRQGDPEAFTLMVRKYSPVLANYGKKFSDDEEVVKDCVQDLFTEIWVYRSRLGVIRNGHTYLLVSLRRKILKQNTRDSVMQLWEPEREDLPFFITFSLYEEWIDSDAERERLQHLNQQINNLPARQKEALYLKFYENMSHEQIAEIMGINNQSVSNLVQRALQHIRQHWKGQFDVYLMLSIIFRG